MASLAQRVTDGFARVATEIKTAIRPRLIPPGGLTNYTLIKASAAPYAVGWAAPPLTHFVDAYVQNGIFFNDPPFNRVAITQLNSDAEGLFNTTSSVYIVPENGLYLINATFRPNDNAGGFEFGFGVHTSQEDGAWFLWTYRPGVNRWAHPYTRIAKLNAGDQLKMFVYGFPQANYDRAGLQISMISKSF